MPEESFCKRCSNPLSVHMKYCPDCTQKTDTSSINYHFLTLHIQRGVLHGPHLPFTP